MININKVYYLFNRVIDVIEWVIIIILLKDIRRFKWFIRIIRNLSVKNLITRKW